MNQKAKIILMSICAATSYGIIHDQITARLCIEYFSAVHPALFPTQSPSLMAFGWGVAATFWIGLLFGALLARTSQSDGLPPTPLSKLNKFIFPLLGMMALAAVLAGFIGFELSRHSVISVPAVWVGVIPSSHYDRFMAAWFAHGASYLFGIGGGTFLIFRIWIQRSKPRIMSVFPHGSFDRLRATSLLVVLGVIAWLRCCQHQ